MGKLLEKLPIINIFKWADGDEYTIEENTVVLPPELAESDQKIDELADKHFKSSKGKSGKGKSQFKVEKDQLNTEKTKSQTTKENVQETERDER